MNWLCICQYGHSRSVALTRVLHGKRIPAVAAGWTTSGDAIAVLSKWADVIALMTPQGVHTIPESERHKVKDFDIGPDRWSNPYSHELLLILGEKVTTYLEACT